MRPPSPDIDLCFDYSAAAFQQAGMGRYGREMVPRLRDLLGARHLSLFTNNGRRATFPPDLAGLPCYRVGLGNKAWRARVALDYARGTTLDRRFHGADLFFAADHLLPRLRTVGSIINIRDLSFLLYPQYHTPPSRLFQRTMMPHFARQADHIIVPSRATRHDIMTHYAIDPAKIAVIPEGVDAQFRAVVSSDRRNAVRQVYNLSRPFVLYVGTLEPRKNIVGLLDAFAALLQEGLDIDLVLAGGSGWLYQRTLAHLQRLDLGDRVRRLGHVVEADLVALYAEAELFAFPSWYEGFGLPPLEAMACGTPVVVSNVASLPEVVGDAGLLVPPGDTAALTAALRAVLSSPQLRSRLAAAGKLRAATFSWEQTAQATLELCRQVVHARRA